MSTPRLCASVAALGLATTLVSCGGDVSLTFRSAVDVQLDTADFDVPAEYQGGGTVTPVPCAGSCPTLSGVTATCVDDVCDPDVISVTVPVGGVVDIEDEVDAAEGTPLASVDSVQLLGLSYEVTRNTLGVDLEPVRLFWTTEDDAAGDALGDALALFPAVPASELPSGDASLDDARNAALTTFFEEGGRRLRFFAEAGTDLAPGGPLPDGAFDVRLLLRLRVVGSVF
ncbi:MAG: hypothetical protein AAF447_02860 [Myxococcota bacterium]